MALEGDEVGGVAVLPFLGWSPVRTEALDQGLGDLPLQGTELSRLAGTDGAPLDLLARPGRA